MVTVLRDRGRMGEAGHRPAGCLSPPASRGGDGKQPSEVLAELAGTTHLDVAAVVTAGGELDPAEGDGALEGHLDGRLLHPVLAVGPRRAGDGAAAEVALYWCRRGRGLD